MTFQHITLALAAVIAFIAIWALTKPASWRAGVAAYPRWRIAGWVLVVLDVSWFMLNIKATPLSSFEHLKVYIWIVGPVLIFLLIRYLDELLAARALGGLMLLVPGAIFDTARMDYDLPLRNVMVVLGYIMAIAGCFLVAGPHKFRRWMTRPAATDSAAKKFGAASALLAVGLAALALTCYGPRVP